MSSKRTAADYAFQPTGTGEWLFYPNGLWGKGYIVPTKLKAELARMQSRAALLLLGGVFLIVVLAIFMPALQSYLFILLLLATLVYWFAIQFALARKLEGVPPAPKTLTLAEGLQMTAKATTTRALWLNVVLWFLLVIVGASLLTEALGASTTTPFTSVINGVGLTVVGLLLLAYHAYLLVIKRRS